MKREFFKSFLKSFYEHNFIDRINDFTGEDLTTFENIDATFDRQIEK